MKVLALLLATALLTMTELASQSVRLDSLQALIDSAAKDSLRVKHLNNFSSELIDHGLYDRAIEVSGEAIALAQELKLRAGEYAAWLDKGNAYADMGAVEKALSNYHKALDIAEIIGDKNKIAGCQRSIGLVYENTGEYDKAMSWYTLSLELSQDIQDKANSRGAWNNIGNIYALQANYPEATRCYLAALELAEEIGDEEGIVDAYNNMGFVALHQKRFKDAEAYFRKCVKSSQAQGRKKNLASGLQNIGNIHYAQLRFDSAYDYYSQALTVRQEINDKYGMAQLYNNISMIYRFTGKIDLTVEYLGKAMEQQRALNDLRGLSAAYLNMANTKSFLGEYEAAADSLKLGINLARRLGLKEIILSGYAVLTDIYEKQEDYKNALITFVEFGQVKDSLLNAETHQKIETLKIEYETEKKQKENEKLILENERHQALNLLLEHEKEIVRLDLRNESDRRLLAESLAQLREDSIFSLNEKRTIQEQMILQERDLRVKDRELHAKVVETKNLTLWFILSGVVLGGIIAWLLYRVRQKRHQQKLKEVEEKALRAQLKPHFVFNAISAIQRFITEKPELADKYLVKFSHFTQEVLVNSENKQIPLADELSMLKKYIELQNLRLKHPFAFIFEIDDMIDPEEIMVPPAIFQPLVENSIYHNFAGKEYPGKLTILAKLKDGVLQCSVEDSCEGTPAVALVDPEHADRKRKSFGLKIVRERLELRARDAGRLAKSSFELIPQAHGMKVMMSIPL